METGESDLRAFLLADDGCSTRSQINIWTRPPCTTAWKNSQCFCLHFHRFIRKVYPQISSIFYMNLAQCYQIMRFFKKLGINFLTKRGPKYLVTFWLFWILSLQSKIAACIYLIPLYKDLGYPFFNIWSHCLQQKNCTFSFLVKFASNGNFWK